MLPRASSTTAAPTRNDIDTGECYNSGHGWRDVNAARVRAQLSVDELWIYYFSLTGDAGPLEVEAYLNGLMPLDPYQHDVLACAINERLEELQLDGHLTYALGDA